MNPLTDARATVANALSSLGVRVYAAPVEVPSLPCVQIMADSDWVSAQRLGHAKADVRLVVRASVQVTGGNDQALEGLEDLIWAIAKTIPVSGTIKGPTLDQGNNSTSYYADLPVNLTASE